VRRLREDAGQTLVLLAGAAVVLLLFAGVLTALGKALLGRERLQRAADLAAVSAARSMRDDFPRLFDRSARGLSKATYIARARSAALAAGRANGATIRPGDIVFPDGSTFAPTRVRVSIRGKLSVRRGAGEEDVVPARASAEAEIGGSDAEQAKLFAQHPDPRWVAPPGRSHFIQRYSWKTGHVDGARFSRDAVVRPGGLAGCSFSSIAGPGSGLTRHSLCTRQPELDPAIRHSRSRLHGGATHAQGGVGKRGGATPPLPRRSSRGGVRTCPRPT
jgi:hypothetical protein